MDDAEKLNSDDQRVLLKEERKIRNKHKREQKKLEKQKEREQLNLLFKLQPQGSNVSLITRDFADHLVKLHVSKANTASPLLKSEDFPALGERSRPATIPVQTDVNLGAVAKTLDKIKPTKKSKIEINVLELINNEKEQRALKKSPIVTDHYSGNSLDSSLPKRSIGKHREVPKYKKASKLKQAILYDAEVFEKLNINCDDNLSLVECDTNESVKYYDNEVTEELNCSIQNFIKEIVNLQEKLYKRNQLKGKTKRFVIGFNEVQKYLTLNKIKLVIIATDIKVVNLNDTLCSTINKLVETASLKYVMHVFALKRRLLGRLTLKHVPVSCIGIINYNNLEEEFKKVSENIATAKQKYIEYNIKENGHQMNEVNLSLFENLKEVLQNE